MVVLSVPGLTSDRRRLLAAAVIVAFHLAVCLWIVARHRRAHHVTEAAATPIDPLTIDGDRTMLVAYASQTGTAAEIAAGAVDQLRAAGIEARLVDIGHLTADVLARARRLLVVASTTGEGDAPDHAEPFVRTVMASPGGFRHLEYGILALGDRSYEQFCAFGRALDCWLRAAAASPLFERIEVDGDDPQALACWTTSLSRLGGRQAAVVASAPTFRDLPIVDRRLLNAGSPGGPAYLVAIDAAGLGWRAGDLAVVRVACGEHQAPVLREYSIASTPACGRLELVVRQVRRPDGQLGLGSGSLTAHTAIGQTVSVRVREHPSFRGPDHDVPMVLIGNGTGMAGLRGHLCERIAAGRHRNWLIFGERTRAHDFLFRDDLDAWRAAGTITRLDVAFSRDVGDGRYVQALVSSHGEGLRAWVDQGAVIYVCGSASGMAPGVDAALTSVLGADCLTLLRSAGRYRRDVY